MINFREALLTPWAIKQSLNSCSLIYFLYFDVQYSLPGVTATYIFPNDLSRKKMTDAPNLYSTTTLGQGEGELRLVDEAKGNLTKTFDHPKFCIV